MAFHDGTWQGCITRVASLPEGIGAACAWCLTSAVVITALMLLSANPARAALARLRSS